MQPRAFNQISIDYTKGTLTKCSINVEKLEDEIHYYLSLPPRIANYFPELFNYNQNYTQYEIEYIPYQSLSDLILKNKISHKEGQEIIYNLFEILRVIHSFPAKKVISDDQLSNFYIQKTQKRIKDLEKYPFFKNLFSFDSIKINNHYYKNFSSLERKFCSMLKNSIKRNNDIKVIHGDFCFGNILYSPSNKKFKLIDPRGSFIYRGIYGHNLYDYSKLMHCLHGRYDYIVNDKVYLYEYEDNSFYIDIIDSNLMDYLESIFINILIDKGMNIEFIYLIEASLFLSMASLHYENTKRQKIFYLRGLILLNHIIEGRYENLH